MAKCREKIPVYINDECIGHDYGRRYHQWNIGKWEIKYWIDPRSWDYDFVPLPDKPEILDDSR